MKKLLIQDYSSCFVFNFSCGCEYRFGVSSIVHQFGFDRSCEDCEHCRKIFSDIIAQLIPSSKNVKHLEPKTDYVNVEISSFRRMLHVCNRYEESEQC